MNIKEILELPPHRDVVGTFTIVTTHKTTQGSDGDWTSRNSITDKTGEMQADFFVGKYQPMIRNQAIEVIQARTQPKDEGCRLYIEEWKYLGEPISEPPEGSYLSGFRMAQKEIKNKIRCRYGEAYLLKYGKEGIMAFLKSKLLDDIAEELTK